MGQMWDCSAKLHRPAAKDTRDRGDGCRDRTIGGMAPCGLFFFVSPGGGTHRPDGSVLQR